jgi:hypothetical protein
MYFTIMHRGIESDALLEKDGNHWSFDEKHEKTFKTEGGVRYAYLTNH